MNALRCSVREDAGVARSLQHDSFATRATDDFRGLPRPGSTGWSLTTPSWPHSQGRGTRPVRFRPWRRLLAGDAEAGELSMKRNAVVEVDLTSEPQERDSRGIRTRPRVNWIDWRHWATVCPSQSNAIRPVAASLKEVPPPRLRRNWSHGHLRTLMTFARHHLRAPYPDVDSMHLPPPGDIGTTCRGVALRHESWTSCCRGCNLPYRAGPEAAQCACRHL